MSTIKEVELTVSINAEWNEEESEELTRELTEAIALHMGDEASVIDAVITIDYP